MGTKKKKKNPTAGIKILRDNAWDANFIDLGLAFSMFSGALRFFRKKSFCS